MAWVNSVSKNPSLLTFFGNDACVRFICPLCISRRMVEDPFDNDKNDDHGEFSKKIERDLNGLKTMILQEQSRTNAKIDQIHSFIESNGESIMNFHNKIDELNTSWTAKWNILPKVWEIAHGNTTETALSNEMDDGGRVKRRRRNSDDDAEIMDLTMNSTHRTGNIEDHTNLRSNDGVSGIENEAPVCTDSLKTISMDEKVKHSKYEVYVSRFRPDETAENIASHVLRNSWIKDEKLFSVAKLMSKRAKIERLDFISFVIMTNDKRAYEALLETSLWPGITVRPFVQKKKSSMPTAKTRREVGKETYKNETKRAPKHILPGNALQSRSEVTRRQVNGLASSQYQYHTFGVQPQSIGPQNIQMDQFNQPHMFTQAYNQPVYYPSGNPFLRWADQPFQMQMQHGANVNQAQIQQMNR